MPNRSNRFPGRCRNCGTEVPADGGVLVGRPGAWGVEHHAGACPEANAAPTHDDGLPVRPDPPEGVHQVNGTVYRVLTGRQSRRLYATQMVPQSNGGRPDFQYVGRRPFRHLSDETLLTFDEACALSAQFGFCIRCGRTLTAEQSVSLGIGPVCGRALHEQERLRRRAADGERTPTERRTRQARQSLSVRHRTAQRRGERRRAMDGPGSFDRYETPAAPTMSELTPGEAL